MSIDRPNKKWRVRYRGFKTQSFTRKADAEAHQEKIKRAKETGRVDLFDADLQPLDALAAEYMGAEASNLSAKTFGTYLDLWAAHVDGRVRAKTAAKAAAAWQHRIATMTLRELRVREIEKWKAERLAAGAGPHAIRKTMALMQTILDRAVRDEAIASNPVRLVKKPSGKRTGRPRVVTPETVERIRANLDETGAMMVSLLAYSGMRPGEARALRWKHIGKQSINIEDGTNPDGTVKATKTEHMRTVRLLDPLVSDLSAWRSIQQPKDDEALLFPRASGGAWTEADWRNFARRKFSGAATRAGAKIGRPYDLRHSAASLWLHEGINPVQIAAWLGHNAQTLLTDYAHVIAELDPDERTSAAATIVEARKTVARDTSSTHSGVQRRATESNSKTRKSSKRAKSAA